MDKGQRRPRGVLKVRRRDAPGALKRAKLMDKGLTDHAAMFTVGDHQDPRKSAAYWSTSRGCG